MVAIITLTKGGEETARKVKQIFTEEAHIYTKASYYNEKYSNSLKALIKDLFKQYDNFIFIMATGIVVRLITPLLIHKSKDPAIVVMDEKAKYAISLVSGHLGGANQLALDISNSLPNCQPVITTASDVNDIESIDIFVIQNGFILRDYENAKVLTAALINGEKILVIDESKSINKLPDNYIFYDYKVNVNEYGGLLVITNRNEDYIISLRKKYDIPVMSIIHKNLVLGIGCRKNLPSDEVLAKVKKNINKWGYSIENLNCIASGWVKKEEKALLNLSNSLGIPYIIYEKADIIEVEDLFCSSDFVRETIGVGSISEPCGYLASNKGKCLIKKVKDEGVTLSLWEMKGYYEKTYKTTRKHYK